ncbi:MAG: S9 family peptidase [Planctomycetota bacterium]
MHPTVALPFAFLVLLAPLRAQEPAAPATPKRSDRLDLELILEWENVSNPRLSPDCSQIVYTRQWTDQQEDRMRSELWIMDADGSRQRFLTKGGDAEWSPDGTRLCYTAEGEPKGSQVFVLWVASREATPVTHCTEAPSNLRWSPDGKRIVFSMQVPEKDGFPIAMPKAPKGAKWADEAKVITRLAYRRDREGYRPAGYRHLFVVDATGGTPRQVTQGDFDHDSPEWTADGKELVFAGLRLADADWQVEESEVYAVQVDGEGTVRQLTDRRGPDANPMPSPDGRFVAYTSRDKDDDTYSIAPLWLMATDGSGKRALTAELDRQPQNLQWATDSKRIYFTVEDEGTVQICSASLDGEVARETRGAHWFQLGSVGANGTIVGTMTTPLQPGAIVAIRSGGGTDTLTAVHDDVLHGKQLGATEELSWKGKDDLEVQGWLVKPPDFDASKRYPLILQIHGGPHAMFGVNFDFERQNHAANGYLVLYTNPRGSTGYGKAFGNAIDNAYPGKDYDDLMAGVDAVIAKGIVDTDNLFVYGGSGGGVLTCWIVGSTNRFRAAVSMFPVTNWISFVGTTDGPYWYTNFEKLPWESIDEHWRRSPLRLVGNVTTPTMMICGELDLRTPMAQTEEYYQALKLRKVDTVLVRVPDEYHGAAGRHVSNRLRRILYVRTWFEKHKKTPSTPPTEAGLSK